ncbi:MAG: HEAT repeat domain-containing protein [Gemmatimonadota bacterium]|nr:HEAT repeat domain-containing protein [Gemmatimonadota bacterium]MDQ6886776.1 HEAT repeat domain-containing protein [Gemmatimonadota bacterium]
MTRSATPAFGGSIVQPAKTGPPRDAAPPPAAVPLIEVLLRDVSRAIRTRQLYLPNNPIYQRALESVGASFRKIWVAMPELVLDISESEFKWEGITVSKDEGKADSLPWLFYKDGVRGLTLIAGFEQQELLTLMDILARVRKATTDEDDLLTLLWEQEFLYFHYRYVDFALEGVAELALLETPLKSSGSPEQAPDVAPEPTPTNSTVNMSDFDSTLYFLDEHEVEYLRAHVQSEYQSDLRRNVLAMLFDIFELEPVEEVREEICTTLERVLVHLLYTEEIGSVAYILRESRLACERAPSLSAAHKERILRLADKLSAPEVLSQLLSTLDASAALAPKEDLDALFQQLLPASLATVLSWMGKLENAQLKSALEDAVLALAGANVAELVRLLLSPDPLLAAEAARRAGQLKTTAAVAGLGKLLSAAEQSVRLAAVNALTEIGSPGALGHLADAMEDVDRDVRVAAIRAVGTRGHAAALTKLQGVLYSKTLRETDLSEKMVVFEAYSGLAGESGIPILAGMLNGRRMIGRREGGEIRACAAYALGRIKSDAAVEALRRSSEDKDALVKSAVNKALRGTR